MTQARFRPSAVVLAMSLAVLSPVVINAQTTQQSGATTSGVTGTDPCPKGYICSTGGTAATSSSQKATTATPATTTNTSTGVLQALLSLLGAS